MKISIEELNELLHKEYERGRLAGIAERSTATKQVTENNTDFLPDGCKGCPNHPSNGGSGNCNCILGLPTLSCTTTTTFEL